MRRVWLGLVAILALLDSVARADLGVQVLVPFASLGTNGAAPNGLTLGYDGNLYGTTYQGGAAVGATNGTVFVTGLDGTYATLAGFQGGNGGGPQSTLIIGSDGNFYGTTATGGKFGFGTVFRVSSDGAVNTLASFTGTAGNYPYYSSLVEDVNGNFYGTSSTGGKYGLGSIFELTNGTIKTLVSFANTNGAYPYSGLVLGNDGNFYGTTYWGGTSANFGTVFQMTPAGALTTLAAFAGDENGAYPSAPLLLGNDGNFYGTTAGGGDSGFGTIFELSTNGTVTSLASFDGENGAAPSAGLTEATNGNFYGAAYSGGDFNGGTVFVFDTNGALSALASLDESTGENPASSIVIGPDGNLYGTALNGGPGGGGTVFTVVFPLTIDQQPFSQVAVPGMEVALSVSTTGTGAVYQWFSSTNSLGATNVTGTNSDTLVIQNVSLADAGSYWVVVSNASGAITSAVVTLTIVQPKPPSIIAPPTVGANGAVSFRFSGTAAVPYSVWGATNLTSSTNWSRLGAATPLTNGVFEFDDPVAASALPARFYQVRWP